MMKLMATYTLRGRLKRLIRKLRRRFTKVLPNPAPEALRSKRW